MILCKAHNVLLEMPHRVEDYTLKYGHVVDDCDARKHENDIRQIHSRGFVLILSVNRKRWSKSIVCGHEDGRRE